MIGQRSPAHDARNSSSASSGAEASTLSIAYVGVALSGKFQSLTRLAEVVFVEAA
jgi:hypothetical protein